MPRPSLKDKRTEEILDAYLTCVARFGLEGATQERIAAQAGVKRPILRHYLGNKDQMIAALVGYVVTGFAAMTDAFEQALQGAATPSDLVEMMFDGGEDTDARLMLAWQALSASVGDYPDARAPLLQSLQEFLAVLEGALRRMAPEADAPILRAVAQGIAAAYVHLDAMAPLAPPQEWRSDLKQAALLLAAGLESTT